MKDPKKEQSAAQTSADPTLSPHHPLNWGKRPEVGDGFDLVEEDLVGEVVQDPHYSEGVDAAFERQLRDRLAEIERNRSVLGDEMRALHAHLQVLALRQDNLSERACAIRRYLQAVEGTLF